MGKAEDNDESLCWLQAELNRTGANPKLDVDGHMRFGGATLAELRKRLWPKDDVRPFPTVNPPTVLAVPRRKLWLSAGHGGSDPGITDGPLREADLAIELRDLIKNRLVGYDVWTDPNAWKTSETAPYLQSHTQAGHVVADIHYNGYNGTAHGVEVIVPVSPTVFEVKLAKSLAKAIANVMGSVLRGDEGMKTEAESQHKRLAMMRPPGENVLIEVCFLDNKAEISRYLSRKEQVADAIADVFKTVLVLPA